MSDLARKIREYRMELVISRADFAASLGEKPSKIQDIETGKQRINDIFLDKFLKKYPVDLEWLFRDKKDATVNGQPLTSPDDAEFVQIRRHPVEASAGHGAQVISETGTGHYAFNRKWLTRRGLNANSLSVILVRGDSMEPDLYEDDLILLDETQIAPQDGQIFVVRFSEGLFVKRIQRLPGDRVHLISRNPNYPPIIVTHPEADGIQIIGRVVASMHEW